MKREEVKGILPDITDEQLQQLMDLHGADIERQKQTIAALTAERDAARGQLEDANGKLEGYDPDWKTKAEEAERSAAQQVEQLTARAADAEKKAAEAEQREADAVRAAGEAALRADGYLARITAAQTALAG